MLLIHYFNMSHFKHYNYFSTELEVVLYGETVFYILDTLNMMFYIWILFSAKQFHYNFNLVSGAQYIIHFIDNLAIMVMRFHWMLGYTDDIDISSNYVFNWAMTVSIYCIVAAMCALPCSILERCFATLYLKDYETNQRPYISYCLVFLLNLLGVIGALILQNKSYTIYVVTALIVLNIIALSLNIFLRGWNKRKYKECHSSSTVRFSRIGKYSLAKRFQISENIKSLHMLNFIIYYMGFMNVVLVVSILASSFVTSPESQALCSLILDASIFLYSFALPQIMTCFCQKWKVQTSAFKEKLGYPKSTSIEPLRDTFGSDMREDVSMNRYFDQLKESWENA
ncbi:hypothetical protein GCK72_018025 [Caenorhabditis remanei]|uniref:Uncharacterized protein n=1 Tax=Caenorhabditis remanei TaxID=31234 RepID=A0A6A5G9N5_CAERE|nr:hypothetical protein GCK72_018025 [Caenorhabditis remanei]KAF1751471.1 hypothetical protein GCK72_018025 [Caenorhabditis remanei]